jgi:type IV secretory pathway VirB10-like protein
VNRRIVLAAAVAAALLMGGAALMVTLTRPAPAPPQASTAPATAPAIEAPVPAAPPAAVPDVAPLPRPAPAPAPEPEAPPPEPVVEAPPETGTLRISSDVPGAQVFLDRQFVGTAPVVSEGVAPGTHQLNVSAEGFDGYVRTIEVTPGSHDITVRFREVRLEAGLDVIHRHGIGSCRGRLVATPQGLRYETTNQNDAFAAALLELDTFQVDYLETNLRVRVANGRQYNFTDPDGNADRLFVFHRDVERARERLRAGDRPAAD